MGSVDTKKPRINNSTEILAGTYCKRHRVSAKLNAHLKKNKNKNQYSLEEYDRIQRLYNVSLKISRIHCKITPHTKIGNMTDTQEERQSMEINP